MLRSDRALPRSSRKPFEERAPDHAAECQPQWAHCLLLRRRGSLRFRFLLGGLGGSVGLAVAEVLGNDCAVAGVEADIAGGEVVRIELGADARGGTQYMHFQASACRVRGGAQNRQLLLGDEYRSGITNPEVIKCGGDELDRFAHQPLCNRQICFADQQVHRFEFGDGVGQGC